MLASSHFLSFSESYVVLFFFPLALHSSSLATLPVDLRIRAPQWRFREIELQWREEDESVVEVIRRHASLLGPSMEALTARLCLFTELVSNSFGIMPCLRVSTVSTFLFRFHSPHSHFPFIPCYMRPSSNHLALHVIVKTRFRITYALNRCASTTSFLSRS